MAFSKGSDQRSSLGGTDDTPPPPPATGIERGNLMASDKATTIYVQQVREPGGWENNASTDDRDLAVARYTAFAAGNARATRLIERTEGVVRRDAGAGGSGFFTAPSAIRTARAASAPQRRGPTTS